MIEQFCIRRNDPKPIFRRLFRKAKRFFKKVGKKVKKAKSKLQKIGERIAKAGKHVINFFKSKSTVSRLKLKMQVSKESVNEVR